MRIVITGGAGMIGSHLVDALLDGGNEIVVVDNFLTGRRQNLAHLAASPRVHIVEADISTASHLPETVGPVDRVYHLASPASPVDYARHPLETLMTNAVGTRNALDVARRWHARFLFTSTSEIYGDPEQHPQPETYRGNVNSLGPRSCYDEGKRFAESLDHDVLALLRGRCAHRAIVQHLRAPLAERRRSHGPDVLRAGAVRQPLTIFGSGLQTRSLCYVSDTVGGLMALMETPASTAKSSISVAPTSAPFSRSRRPSRHWRGARAASSGNRCRSTIRPGVARTSAKPNACWAGDPRPTSRPGSSARSPISARKPPSPAARRRSPKTPHPQPFSPGLRGGAQPAERVPLLLQGRVLRVAVGVRANQQRHVMLPPPNSESREHHARLSGLFLARGMTGAPYRTAEARSRE